MKSYLHLVLCTFLLCACGQASEPAMVFPGENWEEATAASQRIAAAKLSLAIDELKARCGSDGVRELVIVVNGRIIWKGDNIDKVHGIWSFTKSFTSTALGLLVQDGQCTVDTLAAKIAPEMREHYPGVTLRHFTTMTSGYRAVGDEPQGSYKHGPSKTPFAPDSPLFSPPGSQYAYWDSAMNKFAELLTRIADEPLETLIKRRIADPIGIDPTRWSWGDFGAVNGLRINGGSGNNDKHIQISAREAARFGLLYLNNGNWNGRQLLTTEWVKLATQAHVPADLPWAHPESEIDGRGVYGFNWWVNAKLASGQRKLPGAPPGTFWAAGFNNNKCFVIPEWKMVVVRLGLDGNVPDQVWSDFVAKVGQARLSVPAEPAR